LKYRKGYKYQVAETFTLATGFMGYNVTSESGRLSLSPVGKLTIREGYAGDGPSGITLDRKENMVAGFGHDALYQLMREGELPFNLWKYADKEYGHWLELGGAWPITVRINVAGLRLMKGKYAKPENRKRVYTV
jgi:hypothetical protein